MSWINIAAPVLQIAVANIKKQIIEEYRRNFSVRFASAATLHSSITYTVAIAVERALLTHTPKNREASWLPGCDPTPYDSSFT